MILINVPMNELPRNCYLCPNGHVIHGSAEKNGNINFPDVKCDWLPHVRGNLRCGVVSGAKIMGAPCPGGVMVPNLKTYRDPDCPLIAFDGEVKKEEDHD